MIRTFKHRVQIHLAHTGEDRKRVFGERPLIFLDKLFTVLLVKRTLHTTSG